MKKFFARLKAEGILDTALRMEIAALWKYGMRQITDVALRDAVRDFLCIVPQHFFVDPASKSGKMHPPWQNGRHGTLRSIVESCVLIPSVAKHIPEILDNDFVADVHALDVAFAATIISDVWKKEAVGDIHHGPRHGHVAADRWTEFAQKNAPDLSSMCIAEVADACVLHYGLYTPGWKKGDQLPPIARLVNLCDVITSLPSLKTIYVGKHIIE